MAREVIEIHSPIYHACGASLFKILPETNADQMLVGGVTLREHLEGIARAIAGSSVFRFVNTIPERNLLTNLNVGDRVYVTDASADPDINQAVPASYIWMPTHEWRQIGQAAPPDMNDYVEEEGGLSVTSNGKIELATRPWQEGLLCNTEEVITASGDYTAPVTGWYEVTLIGGGFGGYYSDADKGLNGGAGATPVVKLVYLQKHQSVPVIIGAGGTGGYEGSLRTPGATKFGDLVCAATDGIHYISGSFYLWYTSDSSNISGYGYGGGVGGGIPDANSAAACSGKYYGAGGGVYTSPATSKIFVGNGHSGAVILRYYDPLKNASEE